MRADFLVGTLRHAVPRALGEQPRPMAATLRATGIVHVVNFIGGEFAVSDLGELAQCSDEVRDLHRADRVGRLLKYQK